MFRLTNHPSLCLLAFLPVLSFGGCISIKVQGTSGRQLKKASLASPLIRLSDDFYPGDKPVTTGGIVDSLPDAKVAALQKDFGRVLAGLLRVHTAFKKFLDAEMGVTTGSPSGLSVELARENQSTAEVRTDNTIYIDLGVLQAFFKTGIVDMSKKSGFKAARAPGDAPPSSSDDAAVQEFLEFKRKLRKTKGHTVLGELISGGDAWFEHVDMNEAMNTATSRYYGVVLFTLAHEMGHKSLNHLGETCDPNNCKGFADRELAADRYATALLSAAIPDLGMFNFNDNADQLRGYEPFFQLGYKLARFGGISSCSCAYPAPEDRLKLARAEKNAATERLFKDGYIKLQMMPAKK